MFSFMHFINEKRSHANKNPKISSYEVLFSDGYGDGYGDSDE